MVDTGDRAREEFFSEAHEIIEGLSRDLLTLDSGRATGIDPELVNNVFRAVHTLKGLSGLFGATRMGALSHQLESVLDHLRLGKIEPTQRLFDLLFRGVDVFGRILAVEKGTRKDPLDDFEDFLLDLRALIDARPAPKEQNALATYALDPGLLAVLTEYEEHRLKISIEQGLKLFRIRVSFELSSIDEALSSLKTKAKPLGEIITYLPTGDGADAETIELDVLLASAEKLELVREVLADRRVRIDEVPRQGEPARSLPTPAALPPVSESSSSGDPHAAPVTPPMVASALPVAVSDPVAIKSGSPSRPPARPPRPEISLRSVTQTVRVDIRKLDVLMNIVGELSIVRNAVGLLSEGVRKMPEMRHVGAELYRLHRGFERQLAELQNGILEVRMVPLGQLFDKLARVVRQIGREVNKDVNLVITGAETEIDKLIVEELSDPLMHMIRNAIDHAIEARTERDKVGKPPVGTIALNAFQKASHVVIEIEDDGRGIDDAAVLKAAVERGLIAPDQVSELARREVLNLIFIPGLSTKHEAGALSGRGVGMDVVKTNISKLGGMIDIFSEKGIGTKFTVTLPITLAIISALIVVVEGRTFAIPLSSVQEAIWLEPSALREVEGREVMRLRGSTLSVCRLRKLFGLSPSDVRTGRPYAVVVGLGARHLALVVDRIVGQQDIVIKPLGASLSDVSGFAGATELGDQRVALVLDAPAIIEEAFQGSAEAGVGDGASDE